MTLRKLDKNTGFCLVSLFMHTDQIEEKLRTFWSVIFGDVYWFQGFTAAWRVFTYRFFLIRTEQISLFRPNTETYEPQKLRFWRFFTRFRRDVIDTMYYRCISECNFFSTLNEFTLHYITAKHSRAKYFNFSRMKEFLTVYHDILI